MKPLLPVIGLMSGTSVDAVDAALMMTNGETFTRTGITASLPWPDELRARIFDIVDHPSHLDDSDLIQAIEIEIADHHGLAVAAIYDQMNTSAALIGFHGQTVYHKPEDRYSVQLGSGARLAEQTGCPVIYQFRQNDLHHGGQGAPIAPVFHAAILQEAQIKPPAAIINIGGIANITATANDRLISMDTGPGNAMMDRMMQRHQNQRFDDNGLIAASGVSDDAYIEAVLSHDWFHQPPPKSLDRLTTEQMLISGKLGTWLNAMPLAHAMASLAEITARSIHIACQLLPEMPEAVILAGGGARNSHLVSRIRHHMNSATDHAIAVNMMDEHHMDGDFIEAELMAYLAARHHNNLAITFPDTTGIDQPRGGGVRCDPI